MLGTKMALALTFRCVCSSGFCFEVLVNMTVFVARLDFNIIGCVHNFGNLRFSLEVSYVFCKVLSLLLLQHVTEAKNAVLNLRNRI